MARAGDHRNMSTNFLHPRTAGRDATSPSGRAGPQSPGEYFIDWRAARRAGRSCCCAARPAVIAVMPPATDRPHPTELLLCGHHYRASRKALAAAGATVVDIDGTPVDCDDEAWSLARAGV